jgi:hypothetical protein
MRKSTLGVAVLMALFILPLSSNGQNKYVGEKYCAMCHKAEKLGNQPAVWEKTLHANAYKTLLTDSAKELAKAKGIDNPAESKECLECHTLGQTVDPSLFDTKFDIKDGVQCETCHGPGSAYKSMTIMKDKAKAIENGLTDFKDQATIEAFCKNCHNEKSPSFKGFNFAEMWPKIQHPKPAN